MENLNCQSCYQLFEEPVLLQCKHCVCSKCARMLFSSGLVHKLRDHYPFKKEHKQKQQQIQDMKKTVDICCPQCNKKTSLIATQGITELTRDLELDEKVKKLQEPKVFMCSNEHDQQATFYCEKCKENYCKQCFDRRHSVSTRTNHRFTEIDGNSPPSKSIPPTTCSKHGHPLDMFCQRDQVACCHQCFELGNHKGHEPTFVSHIVEMLKTKADGQLITIGEQVNKSRQTLGNMDNLKKQVIQSHVQFKEKVTRDFDRVIDQLVKKKNELVEESNKIEGSTLSNIMLQQQVLGELLMQKTYAVELTNKWSNGSDLQVGQCKKLLQRNQELIGTTLICYESGKISTTIDVSPVEQVIGKLGSIVKIPVDLKLPIISGLKECKQDKESVTIQWNPVNCDFPEMYFVVQTRADNDDSTMKIFKVLSNMKNLQVPVAENWKQLVCTVRCEIDEQFQGIKCASLTINLIGNDLHSLKEKYPRKIYERMQQIFSQKETKLDLSNCNIDDVNVVELATILLHFTQLQELYLHGNRIGDIGATAIANSITNLTQLQKLNLRNNQIGDAGATAISKSISRLTRLNSLNLKDNNLSEPVQRQFGNNY